MEESSGGHTSTVIAQYNEARRDHRCAKWNSAPCLPLTLFSLNQLGEGPFPAWTVLYQTLGERKAKRGCEKQAVRSIRKFLAGASGQLDVFTLRCQTLCQSPPIWNQVYLSDYAKDANDLAGAGECCNGQVWCTCFRSPVFGKSQAKSVSDSGRSPVRQKKLLF